MWYNYAANLSCYSNLRSSRLSYGDDAISHVQLKKRDGKICTVKCKFSVEGIQNYMTTLILDEEKEAIISVQCYDCVAAQGGCKNAVAFLMWLHRRSEEPSCTYVECYWRKSKLSKVGTNLK
ncbi:hypothetical protein EVAR_94539_1 [Eumeta japonica]|uniref:Uncharacterized protein n=1 Tax=Eumeta variegata TaxID=151549 RepID=A0A4C1UVG3_EUMVA|nr:hypothetical protein EVAR_94539_1 [Eumeta japonica]